MKPNMTTSATLRPIQAGDDDAMARIIRSVMSDYGATGEGYSSEDAEVAEMSTAYAGPRHAYFVLEQDNAVIGGAGIGPLAGGDQETCELRKMYLLATGRGQGLGQKLLDQCLTTARDLGYSQCYLETLGRMREARRLYVKNGFAPLTNAVGNTGHSGCDSWMIKAL